MEKIPGIFKMDFMISPVSPDTIRELVSIKLCFVLKLFQEFQKVSPNDLRKSVRYHRWAQKLMD